MVYVESPTFPLLEYFMLIYIAVYPTEINSLTMRTKGAALGAATN